MVQQQVALLGGGWHGRSMTVFDPGTHSWRAAQAPHICRLHSAVASMQASLFVLVGAVLTLKCCSLCCMQCVHTDEHAAAYNMHIRWL